MQYGDTAYKLKGQKNNGKLDLNKSLYKLTTFLYPKIKPNPAHFTSVTLVQV